MEQSANHVSSKKENEEGDKMINQYNLITTVLAIPVMACLGCSDSSNYAEPEIELLEFTNIVGDEYKMEVQMIDGEYYLAETDRKIHHTECAENPNFDEDDIYRFPQYCISDKDYIVVTDGTLEKPSGHEQSVTSIWHFIGFYSGEDYGFVEFKDMGSGRLFTCNIYWGENLGDFALCNSPINLYIMFVNTDKSSDTYENIGMDQNGQSASKISDGNYADPTWGEPIHITGETGVWTFEEVLR